VEIVRISGEYDLSRKDEFVALFQSLDSQPLVIDLTEVTYVDSTILRELAALKARDMQRPITLCGVNEHLRRILQIVQFDKIFEITP
jgi:anti-anti-sigma factor